MNYDWNFSRLAPYTRAFASGTATTLTLTFWVVVLGTIVGVGLGLVLRRRAAIYAMYPIIDVIRAIPPLVLLLFFYFLLSRNVIGRTVDAYWVCVIGLSLNLAAFVADLVRAAVANVPASVIDAGLALGMRRHQVTRHVVLPHVARELLPSLTALYIGMLKLSSLASIINVRDVVYAAQTVIADISRSLEAWVIVGVIYVVLVLPATYGARRLERWSRRGSERRSA
ncbi:MAG: ABC transporter permease subunit [Opitutaceae bacterium]|nr:ABC transporter permease subunit [Opitutaceae bacterium]